MAAGVADQAISANRHVFERESSRDTIKRRVGA